MRMISVMMVVLSFLVIAAHGFCNDGNITAEIVNIIGNAEVYSVKDKQWAVAKIGNQLQENDFIRTKAKAEVLLKIKGNSQSATITIKENSQLALRQIFQPGQLEGNKTLLDLAMGEIFLEVGKLKDVKSEFEVKTPTSIVGVRGTKFSVKVEGI